MLLKGIDTRCLTLVAAAGCNLNCKYCQICATQNQFSGQLLTDIINSIEDGTYIQNVIKVLNRLEQSPNKIDKIHIWGQEPTIMMPYLTKHISEWLEAFPETKEFFFSTNGMNSSDIIFDFIKEIDKNAKQQIDIGIQVSYDGKYGQEFARGGDGDFLKNNFIQLNQKLNNYNLKHVEVGFHLHGVLSFDMLKEINTIEKVIEYFDELDNFILDIHNSWNNKKVRWVPHVTLQYQNGVYASTEDGILLNNFFDLVDRARHQKEFLHFKNVSNNFVLEALGAITEELANEIFRYDCTNLEEYIQKVILDKHGPYRYAEETPYCCAYLTDLKIMYDGSVTTCQNYIYDLYMDENSLKNDVYDQTRKHLVKKKTHLLNFITASDNEIIEYYNHHQNLLKEGTIYFMINQTANLMYMMAKSGQIDSSYSTDFKKLQKHAFLISALCTCLYNIAVVSGSVAIRSTGDIRELCNGVLDRYEYELNKTIKERGRELLKQWN